MKNPLTLTSISLIASSVLIFIIAIIFDYNHASGEQYFLAIIIKAIYFQSILCSTIYILSGILFKKWVLQHKVIYILFLILILVWTIFILFFNHQ